MLLLSISPGVCLVWNKVLPSQCSPSFVLSLTTPALLFILVKTEGEKAPQFSVSIFHNEKLRCGSRGSMVLTIQTNYVSTGGNRSQQLPLLPLHPRYHGPGTPTKLIYCASSAIFFFTSHRGNDLSEVKKHSVQKTRTESLCFYTIIYQLITRAIGNFSYS